MFGEIYQGKRVFVTGHTGFKGGWLALWLEKLGAEVFGYSLAPTESQRFHPLLGALDQHLGDIRDNEQVCRSLEDFRPDFVFHLAAQPIVLESYRTPLETFETNVTGTANLLEAIRKLALETTVVSVTSDKCYENKETGQSYREGDPLGGKDVYSMSKAAAELVAASWRNSFFKGPDCPTKLATARAGNVIGGGDFAADRIVPDCVRKLERGEAISVRNPTFTRPWQHVLDSLSGYLALGAFLHRGGDPGEPAAFNFGPNESDNRSVEDLVTEVLQSWPGTWEHQPTADQKPEAGLLGLSIDKARSVLDWKPTWDFPAAVEKTIQWYRQDAECESDRVAMRSLSLQQIDAFAAAAREASLPWALTTP